MPTRSDFAVGDRVTVVSANTHSHWSGGNGSPRGDNRIEPGDVGVIDALTDYNALIRWWGTTGPLGTGFNELRKLTDQEVGSAMTTTPTHLDVETLPERATALWKTSAMDTPMLVNIISNREEPDSDGDYLVREQGRDYDSQYANKTNLTPYETPEPSDWHAGDRVVQTERWDGAEEVRVGMTGVVEEVLGGAYAEDGRRLKVNWDQITDSYAGAFGHGVFSMRLRGVGRTARAADAAVAPEVPDSPEVVAFKEKAWYKAQEAKKLYGFCGEIDKVLESLKIEQPKTFMPAGYYRFKGAKDLYFKPAIDTDDNGWKQVRRSGQLRDVNASDVRYIREEKKADRVELVHEI